MKNLNRIICFVVILSAVFVFSACDPGTDSNTAIIGGADGPTDIIVTQDGEVTNQEAAALAEALAQEALEEALAQEEQEAESQEVAQEVAQEEQETTEEETTEEEATEEEASATQNTATEEDVATNDLTVLFTSDTHGRVSEDILAPSIGYARIAQIKKDLQEQGENVLLLSAGDEIHGTPVVNADQGISAIEFMNITGYDAMAIGEAELTWGTNNVQSLAGWAEFSLLSANILQEDSDSMLTKGNQIFVFDDGLKVGVFGLTTPEAKTQTNPDDIAGYMFLEEQELYDTAQAQVDALIAQECDIVICLGHLGSNDNVEGSTAADVIRNVEGIDLFIDGHSHKETNETINDTLLVQTAPYGQSLGQADISGDKKSAHFIPAVSNDDDVATLINSSMQVVEQDLSQVIAISSAELNGNQAPGVLNEETNLGDLAADALLWQARQAVGQQEVSAAIVNGGSIKSSVPAGEVTIYDIEKAFPYDNSVCVVKVSGKQLLEAFEAAMWNLPNQTNGFLQVSGIEYSIDTAVKYSTGVRYEDSVYYSPLYPGERVTIHTVNGELFSESALYNIATTDFIALGGDAFYVFRHGEDASSYDTGIPTKEAYINYLGVALEGQIGEEYAQSDGRITIEMPNG